MPLYAAPATTEEVIRMISDESKRKLRELQLDSMVDALDDQDSNPDTFLGMSFDDRMNLLIDVCYTNKRADRAKRLLRYAKLRYPNADINTMYYDGRDLDRNTVLNLGTCSFINVRQNIIINGFTGSGKTHLACALGKEACRHLHRTRYLRMPEMLEMLNLAMETGHSITSVVTKLSNYHLLIIDEWLLDIPTEQEDKYLLEIFERRYDQWPTIFCSQYKTSEWHPRLGGGVVADAIMDRIVHNSTTINAGKLNMREFLAMHQRYLKADRRYPRRGRAVPLIRKCGLLTAEYSPFNASGVRSVMIFSSSSSISSGISGQSFSLSISRLFSNNMSAQF